MAYYCGSGLSYSSRSVYDRHGIAWEDIVNKRLINYVNIGFLNVTKNLIH